MKDTYRSGTRVTPAWEMEAIFQDHDHERFPFRHYFPGQGEFMVEDAYPYKMQQPKSRLRAAITDAVAEAMRDAGVVGFPSETDDVWFLVVRPIDGPEGRW